MTWIVWALMLITHGGFSRWAKSSRFYALASLFADALLIAIALITVEQLQGLGILEILRVGLFFVAFAGAGQQLMHSVLGRGPEDKGPPGMGPPGPPSGHRRPQPIRIR
jgi:hypothetical protein